MEAYFDILGSDWQVARIFGGITASLALYSFLYLLSFICSSQVRGVRYFTMFFIAVVLTTFQGLTFMVFRSSLCDQQGCTFSRSAAFAVCSIGCLLISGLCFLNSRDYPGDRWTGGVAKVAPADGAAVATATGEEAVGGDIEQDQAKTMPPLPEEGAAMNEEQDENEDGLDVDDIIEEEEIVEWPEGRGPQEDDDYDHSEELVTEGAMYGDEDEAGQEIERIPTAYSSEAAQ